MVKTFITLDPEYIPWAPQTPNVKLRHKHNKFVEFVLPIIAGIAVIGGIWFYVGRGPSGQGGAVPSVGAAAAPVVAETSGSVDAAIIADAAPVLGKLGYVTLRARRGDMALECRDYRVMADNAWIASGSTVSITQAIIDNEVVRVYGALVDVSSHREFEVLCDGQSLKF